MSLFQWYQPHLSPTISRRLAPNLNQQVTVSHSVLGVHSLMYKHIESVQHRFFRIMTPRLGLSDLFVEHVYSENASKFRILSSKITREFNDTKFLFEVTNDLFECPLLVGYLMCRVPVRRIRQNDSFEIGNYLLLYTANCPTTRMCEFALDRGIDVFEIALSEIKAILLEFEWGTAFWKIVAVTAARFVDWVMVIVMGYV